MEKIPTLFERDWEGDRSRVLDAVVEGCEWVVEGEGVATRKYDGTCCLIRDGRLYKRHEVRPGKAAPENFKKVSFDEETDKMIGWVPVGDGPEDRWHREAFDAMPFLPEGTYELLGPKIQGNPEGFEVHTLVAHRDAEAFNAPRDFAGLAVFIGAKDIEGIVWHHYDGRMAKIKAKDFGIRRGAVARV